MRVELKNDIAKNLCKYINDKIGYRVAFTSLKEFINHRYDN
jgi:hypothetical protein